MNTTDAEALVCRADWTAGQYGVNLCCLPVRYAVYQQTTHQHIPPGTLFLLTFDGVKTFSLTNAT